MNEITTKLQKFNTSQTITFGLVAITAIIVLGTGGFSVTEEALKDGTTKRNITYSHN